MLNFEWDKEKAVVNFKKHGVSFEDASTIFCDTLSMTFADPEHSLMEDRYIIIGITKYSKLLVVSHIYKGEIIRIISARPATKREIYFYEN